MTRDEILSELQSSLEEMFDIDPRKVTPKANLRDDLDLDSIDAIDLAVRLKTLLGRRVELSVLKELRTVEDVVVLIEQEIEAKQKKSKEVSGA
jgi:acyl carrier protein